MGNDGSDESFEATEVDSGSADDDDDVDGSSSIEVTDVDSGDDSSDEIVSGTNTDDDDANGSLFRNKGKDGSVFGQYGEDEEAHWNVSFSQNALGNLWGMASVIMVVCL